MRRTLSIALAPFWILVALLGGAPRDALSAAPAAVNHQGLLVDTLGAPLDGTVDLAVRIWEDPTSTLLGDIAYFEDHLATPVVDGVYSIEIGTGTSASGPFTAVQFGDPDRWLEIVVNGEVMAPRQKLLSVIYALQAEICADAATLGGLTSANIIASAQSSIPFSNLIGLISDVQVPAGITRDAEVVPLVLASDGPGSGLNADLLDGLSSASFSQLGPTIESAEITDLTIGTADLANASVTAAKLVDGAASGVDADLLDGLESTTFLRNNVATTFTGATLFITPSSNVDMNGTLRIGQDSDADNDTILFDAGGESLEWHNVLSGFQFSDDLRAGSYTLTTPITRTLRISGNSFVPAPNGDSTWSLSIGGYGNVDSGTSPLSLELGTAVNLPVGATITQFSCSVYSDAADPSLGNALLLSQSGTLTGSTAHGLVVFAPAASASVQIFADASISAPTVDAASTYSINVNWFPGAVGTSRRFYGCAIEYQSTIVD